MDLFVNLLFGFLLSVFILIATIKIHYNRLKGKGDEKIKESTYRIQLLQTIVSSFLAIVSVLVAVSAFMYTSSGKLECFAFIEHSYQNVAFGDSPNTLVTISIYNDGGAGIVIKKISMQTKSGSMRTIFPANSGNNTPETIESSGHNFDRMFTAAPRDVTTYKALLRAESGEQVQLRLPGIIEIVDIRGNVYTSLTKGEYAFEDWEADSLFSYGLLTPTKPNMCEYFDLRY